jgi:solute carrier family 6 amino acid/orphan transporter-like 15/16/17/18/20
MLLIEGMPIFFLELAIGQRLRKGAVGVWSQVSPYLAGVGIASAVVSYNVALYYNTIISWCLLYFVRVRKGKAFIICFFSFVTSVT